MLMRKSGISEAYRWKLPLVGVIVDLLDYQRDSLYVYVVLCQIYSDLDTRLAPEV